MANTIDLTRGVVALMQEGGVSTVVLIAEDGRIYNLGLTATEITDASTVDTVAGGCGLMLKGQKVTLTRKPKK